MKRILNVLAKFQQRRTITALFLNGDKAKDAFAVLTPYMTIEDTMSDRKKLETNFQRRNLDFNFNDFYRRYFAYKQNQTSQLELETEKEQIVKQISGCTNEDEKEKLKNKSRNLREQLKKLRHESYEIEDNFIKPYLELPNEIHPEVPERDEVIFFNIKDTKKSKNHLEIDQETCIEYIDSSNFFLKNEAAKFDYYFPQHCFDHFKKYAIPFSNPDFVRTLLVEAGSLPILEKLFLVKEEGDEEKVNLLHLCGGGSILSFLGFITKLQIFGSLLPFICVSIGKEYQQVLTKTTNHDNLFGGIQGTAVQLFSMAKDSLEAMELYDKIAKDMIALYNQIEGLQFEVIINSATTLQVNESMKTSFRMYSNSNEEYIEIGNVTYYGDYISKRILCTYKDEKQLHFPHIISAKVVDIPKLIACWTENCNRPFKFDFRK